MNARQLRILALAGILIVVLGTFLPVEAKPKYSGSDWNWHKGSLFDFNRFDGPNMVRTIRNGISSNGQGICLLGLTLITLYAALTFENLGEMSVITLAYITLLLAALYKSSKISLNYGWLFLYGGGAMTAAASFLHSRLPQPPSESSLPGRPSPSLGQFEPPSE